MGGAGDALGGKLLLGLNEHGGVALHDPLGDLGVALPGGIADHFPAVGAGIFGDLADGIIVVAIHNRHFAAIGANAADAVLSGEFMDVDLGAKAHFISSPGHTGSVVAIRGGGKYRRTQFFAVFTGKAQEIPEGDLVALDSAQFQEAFVDGIGAAQYLE